MLDEAQRQLRHDCHRSLESVKGLAAELSGHRIACIGGTGFLGTWVAEVVAALNDEYSGSIQLDLFGRSASKWPASFPHLQRKDIQTHVVDVRSPFELPRDTTLVVFAAGIADPRVHASDPQRVFQTNVHGLEHALAAAARLEKILRFVNVSSGLVAGSGLPSRPIREDDIGFLDFRRLHNLYAETRRAAESLACGYASQYRMPVSTARAFTFLGPYQSQDAPWAINNFIRDALAGHEIRIHGDGATRRSYLYGSDAAVWLLRALMRGTDGQVYNLGGEEAISHGSAAAEVARAMLTPPPLIYKSQPNAIGRNDDFYPDVSHTMNALGVRPSFDVRSAIRRTLEWHAQRTGSVRRLRTDA
jgi:dTDP-glucose 4,6-dehydratase